jgi:hypothetical protein
MDRSLLSGLTLLALLTAPLVAAAGEGSPTPPAETGVAPAAYANGTAGGNTGHPHWDRFWLDFYRNNTWPEPFLTADRAAARTPFCIQTDNGWKMQNTIGSFLFDVETQRVNQAGELLVKWIVSCSSPGRVCAERRLCRSHQCPRPIGPSRGG